MQQVILSRFSLGYLSLILFDVKIKMFSSLINVIYESFPNRN